VARIGGGVDAVLVAGCRAATCNVVVLMASVLLMATVLLMADKVGD
jgi:coenzyme F420-reducing hydrogenase delta subunit